MADERYLSRRRLLATTGAGAAAGLAGCFDGGGGGGSDGSEDPTELPPVHMLTDFNNDAWQAKWDENLVPKFQEETDIEIDMEYAGFSGGGQEERLATLLQSGDPPDLSEGTMEQLADVWAAGHLQTSTEAVEGIMEVAGGETAKLFRDPDGETLMFPHGYYTGVLHYREDVYEELGLEPPTSYRGLIENAKTIDESDMDIRGYGLSATKQGKGQDEYNYFLGGMGVGQLRIKDGTMEDDVPEAEFWFPKEEMLEILEIEQELAQYSPDPASIGWGESLGDWAAGRFAQQWNLNMWPGGVAAGVDDTIAENTGAAAFPMWEEGGVGIDDLYYGSPTPNGHFAYKEGDNPQGAVEWMKWLYGDTMERTGRMFETEPTRFLPYYADIVDSDAYQSYDHWDEFPSHLEGLRWIQQEMVPEYYGNVEDALAISYQVPEARYYYRFFLIGEMVNQVVVGDRDPEAAYEEAKGKAEQRLQEGKERLR